jgi:hypothetical protein
LNQNFEKIWGKNSANFSTFSKWEEDEKNPIRKII